MIYTHTHTQPYSSPDEARATVPACGSAAFTGAAAGVGGEQVRGGGAGGGGGEVWGRQLHLPGLDCPQGTGHQL